MTERPVAVPHLPAGRVTLATAAAEAAAALQSLGVRVVSPTPHRSLPAEIGEHTDLLLCPFGGGRVFVAPGQEALHKALEENGISVSLSGPVGGEYPGDVPLNVAVGKSFALGNFRFTDARLLNALSGSGIRLLRVKQGYTKCAVCPVTERAYVTDDPGVAAALRAVGADVLEIGKGDVYLSEKHYGFFGGAAGMVAPDLLAVNGSLRRHRDGARIRAFLEKHGVTPAELFDGQLRDVGGIIPLLESSTS